MIDPTPDMLCSQLVINPYSNPLLRWIGVRATPHMPCSFHCQTTIRQGKEYMELMPDQEREWALELLNMPMLYSTLHGVGEVVTPIFKLSFSSQGVRTFELWGDQPDGTVGGSKFPFVEDNWTYNGFYGPASMDRAHKVILKLVSEPNFVIDFGCGNGYLLSKISAVKRMGIDNNFDAIQQGRRLYNDIKFVIGDINELPLPDHDLSLISLERFVESPSPIRLADKLGSRAIVYSYSDGVQKFVDRLKLYFSDWSSLGILLSSHTAAAILERHR
jgi:hypothetical protein